MNFLWILKISIWWSYRFKNRIWKLFKSLASLVYPLAWPFRLGEVGVNAIRARACLGLGGWPFRHQAPAHADQPCCAGWIVSWDDGEDPLWDVMTRRGISLAAPGCFLGAADVLWQCWVLFSPPPSSFPFSSLPLLIRGRVIKWWRIMWSTVWSFSPRLMSLSGDFWWK